MKHQIFHNTEPEERSYPILGVVLGCLALMTVVLLYTLMFYKHAPKSIKEHIKLIEQLRQKYFPSIEEWKKGESIKLKPVGETDTTLRFRDGVSSKIKYAYVVRVDKLTNKWDRESISYIVRAELAIASREESIKYTAEETMNPKIRNRLIRKIHTIATKRLSDQGIMIKSFEMLRIEYSRHFIKFIKAKFARAKAEQDLARVKAEQDLAISKAQQKVKLWTVIVELKKRVKKLEGKHE